MLDHSYGGTSLYFRMYDLKELGIWVCFRKPINYENRLTAIRKNVGIRVAAELTRDENTSELGDHFGELLDA